MTRTFALLAARYRGQADAYLTHRFPVNAAGEIIGRSLCKLIKPEAAADQHATSGAASPTCVSCDRAWGRSKFAQFTQSNS